MMGVGNDASGIYLVLWLVALVRTVHWFCHTRRGTV